MSSRITQTQAMLARHHRDGERFAQIMKESFANRFDDEFWGFWKAWMEPVYSDKPHAVDLGAGPGMFVKALAERYPGMRVDGVECAPYMLDAVEPLPAGCSMISEDLHDPRLPFGDGTVDVAMGSVVLHEMNQPVRLLLELHRCLKKGGRLLVLDWVRAPLEVYIRHQTDESMLFDTATPVEKLEDLFVHFVEHNRFSREDLVYLLNHTGFAVIDSHLERDGRFARLVAERR